MALQSDKERTRDEEQIEGKHRFWRNPNRSYSTSEYSGRNPHRFQLQTPIRVPDAIRNATSSEP
ncbi:hypothetical protein HanXRQr2_Chr10g0423461 [Helianthus annuus]|uniref:Uncharacterized protein n=1 Tax=Helianthus annuus TaxID=4232 RepID=A0A9K3N2V9_HELAN|nr:hypothetical protein HanXRQr2_Chr10g0423461 [Helianthus annuus]KAJ0882390.1 hypothetical protein HanPSC8_Chr10g0409101 [Helianthus annuus]